MNLMYTDQGAIISTDGLHRYRCWWTWSAAPPLAWLMLNPSTADGQELDPTLRRVEGFSRREKAGGFEIWNLWSLMATDPAELWEWLEKWATEDEHAPNRDAILAELPRFSRVVCAWGDFSKCPARLRADAVRVAEAVASRLREAGAELVCLGTSKSGQPLHPLYRPADSALLPYEAPSHE